MATQLNENIAAEIIRKRPGMGGREAFEIIQVMPEALKRFARKVAGNPYLRDLLLTDKNTVTLSITSGKVDLTTLYSTHKAIKEFLDVGNIWHTNSDYPLQKVSVEQGANLASFTTAPTDFIYYYIEGQYLILPGGQTGSLAFAVPYYPAAVTNLPISDELETLFLDTVYEMLIGEKTDFTNENVKDQ